MGCIIAALLYAEDAAIPADSLEDLTLAVKIFEGRAWRDVGEALRQCTIRLGLGQAYG